MKEYNEWEGADQRNKKSKRDTGNTDRNFEINHLLCKSRHFIVKTKSIFANRLCGKHKISLSLLCTIYNQLLIGPKNGEINIERSAGLDLELH